MSETSEGGYQPTPEEIAKAENMMTYREKVSAKSREVRQLLVSRLMPALEEIVTTLPSSTWGGTLESPVSHSRSLWETVNEVLEEVGSIIHYEVHESGTFGEHRDDSEANKILLQKIKEAFDPETNPELR